VTEADMKICLPTIRFFTALFVVINGACLTTSPNNLRARIDGSSANEMKYAVSRELITREQAVTIANVDAARKHPALEFSQTTTCERARLWVIIYDVGLEYYVDKMSGAIVLVQQLPLDLSGATPRGPQIAERLLSKQQAVEIAKKQFADFLVSENDAEEQVNDYDAVACELSKGWRVFFEDRVLPGKNLATAPNSNPPNYLIDKKTGGILYTTHHINE